MDICHMVPTGMGDEYDELFIQQYADYVKFREYSNIGGYTYANLRTWADDAYTNGDKTKYTRIMNVAMRYRAGGYL